MALNPHGAGMAALSIVESILLALEDGELLSSRQIRGLLEDACELHIDAIHQGKHPEVHQAAISLIERILRSRS